MISVFVHLYHFFKQQRAAWIGSIFLLFLGLWLFIGTNIQLNQDVAKIIPLDKGIRKVNAAYQNSKFSDNLIFHLYLNDSLQSSDDLIIYADSLVQQLYLIDSSKIERIRYTLSDQALTTLYDFFYENIPLFLDSTDYQDLSKRLDSTGVQNALQSVYKTLLSPTGFILKKKALKDPFGLATIPLKKLEDFQIEGNYTLYNNRIMTEDKQHLLFFVQPKTQANATGKNAQLLAEIDHKIAAVNQQFNDQFSVEYFGSIAVSVANAQQIKQDINYTVGAALLALLLFIALFFKRITVPIIIFIPALLGATVGLAVLVFCKESISAISLGVGAVLLGITIDFSLHVFTHFRAEAKVTKTIQDVAMPTMMSGMTTASAFLCLLYMSSEAMRDLGIFAAAAVFSSALFALLLLPQLLPQNTKKTTQNTFIDRLAQQPFHRSKLLKFIVFSGSILFLFFYKNVHFEDDMNRINYLSEALKTADDNLQKMGGEALRSTYIISADSLAETALEANEKVGIRLQQLKQQGLIQNFTSTHRFLLSQKKQKQKIAQWQQFWTSKRKATLQNQLIKQGRRLKFKDSSFNAFYAHINQIFTPIPRSKFNALETNILSEFTHYKNNQHAFVSVVKLNPNNKSAIYQQFQDSERITIFDKQFIADQFAASLQADFSLLANWSFLIVFLILLLFFGRIELAVLTMFPILLSWEWTLGIMAILGLKFNLVNIIICTFVFGLGVDYSIFITKGLLHQYKYNERILPAYKTSIILSALTTLCGMGVMIFAQHPALHSIASLSVIGILSILFISFTIQPVIFEALIVGRSKKGLAPYTLRSSIATLVAYLYFVSGCLVLSLVTRLLTISPFRKNSQKHLLHRLIYRMSKSLIYLMFNVKKIYPNKAQLQLNKPAVIIANHQSFLDIMMILMLHPKIIIMTNSWVWNSPIFGRFIRFADFIPADAGAESSAEKLESLIHQGYSVMIFPEGTRSKNGKIARFKKGAFYLAEKFNLDILPIIFHGTGDCIRKNDFMVHSTTVQMKALPRISPQDLQWGLRYSERSKSIGKYFKSEYKKVHQEANTAASFKNKLIHNYIYKGPVLEWYTRIKIQLEDLYRPFDRIIPTQASIVDIGCGYGMMSYMLHLLSSERSIIGIDYDDEKIKVAQNAYLHNKNIQFIAADITQYQLPKSDVFLISDMLHYISKHAQKKLIQHCIDQLQLGGTIIIRDGDSDLKKRHEGTRWTETFSTQIFGFNKINAEGLSYLSGKDIENIAQVNNLTVERIDLTQKTSNIIYIMRK